jgi:hypothetical protein
MQVAFKEWAVVVDALGSGRQILILRKGGIHEGKNGFQPEHQQFLLFPTLFHQQRESVVPEAQARYDQIKSSFSDQLVRIEFLAEVAGVHLLKSEGALDRLRGLHLWTDPVLRDRFQWGREQQIHALVLRVYRLGQPSEVPLRPEYGGCKSWVSLQEEISTAGSDPVVSDPVFAEKFLEVHRALEVRMLAAAPVSLST